GHVDLLIGPVEGIGHLVILALSGRRLWIGVCTDPANGRWFRYDPEHPPTTNSPHLSRWCLQCRYIDEQGGGIVEARIRKWGNSPAVRIPVSVMSEAGVEIDTPVRVFVDGGRIVIEPSAKAHYSLDRLVDGITSDNVHGEVDFGAPVGREIW
ncbi:MAG: hypothetical protein RJB01_42, partial [Actinomycetota bacterium]